MWTPTWWAPGAAARPESGSNSSGVALQRTVVAFTGDGELMMNGQELVTSVRYDTPMLVVLVDNEQYGTIRANQEKTYPGRV